MKIEKVKNLEVENIGGMESGVKAGISKESYAFLFELVSKSLYSNPIGSTVREIVSNGFDAHIAAGVDEPVIVKRTFDYDEDCFYFHVIDKGTGMSSETIIHIYMNYFSSTKRDTNEQIGGFGIGSKTPLSYQELFYITTVHNGKKYECILSRGEAEPELDSFHGFEERIEIVNDFDEQSQQTTTKQIPVKYPIGIDTDEPNGTEIKVAVNKADLNKFETEIKAQLCYFDNVFFSGWTVSNHYKIFEGNTFKYRDRDQYFKDEMHIVLGKVSYPINWKELGMIAIQIPIAVKFEIGELVVTPNRESLRYTDEVKALVKERIKACIEELVSKYNEQNPQIDNIFEYMDKRNERPHIRFDENTKLFIPKIHGVENNVKYSPLADIPFIPSNPFFEYDVVGKIEGGQVKHTTTEVKNIVKNNYKAYLTKDKNYSMYKNLFLGSGFVVVKKKLSFKDYCEAFDLYYYEKYIRYSGKQYDITDNGKKLVPILGKAKLIKKYKEHIASLVMPKLQSYQDVEVDEEWLKEYKLSVKLESDAYRRKMEQKVMVKINRRREEIKIEDLTNAKLVFYEIMEDNRPSNTFMMVEDLLDARPGFKALVDGRRPTKKDKDKYTYIKDRIYIIEIAKTNFKYIKDLPNLMHVNDFLKPKNRLKRLFRDFATSFLIKERATYRNERIIHDISSYYGKKLDIINKFCDKHKTSDIYSHKDKIMAVAKEYNLYDQSILLILDELDKFMFDMEIVSHIYGYPSDRVLTEMFRYKKKLKLNSNLYKLKPRIVQMPVEQPQEENQIVTLNQENNEIETN